MTSPSSLTCPLCNGSGSVPFHRDDLRVFHHCGVCDLVYVSAGDHLSPADEKARYDHHRNDTADPGYRRFLERLFMPMKAVLAPGASGLDYGCGPVSSLAVLFTEAGFSCADFDRYYAPVPERLRRQYDFVTCSETMEHFRDPRGEFERLLRLVKPGGWLGVMTQVRDPAKSPFDRWHYKGDLTHICFYSQATFAWLATTYTVSCVAHPQDVFLFQLPIP